MSAGGVQTTSVDGGNNALTGCNPTSAGCKNCFVLRRYPGGVQFNAEELALIHDCWRYKPNGLYMMCGESDLLIPKARPYWKRIADAMRARPDVLWLVLTKQVAELKEWHLWFGVIPNLWFGTSAENQEALDRRVPLLYATPAAGYAISTQPLIGQLDLSKYLSNPKLRYVLSGCEKGPKARPCPKAWLDSIRDQCAKYPTVSYFCVRWRDAKGKIQEAGTRNDRGSHAKGRKSYRSRRPRKTIGELYFAPYLPRPAEPAPELLAA